MDSSSAILLYKVDFISLVTDLYEVMIPRSVEQELTDHEDHVGAPAFGEMCQRGKLKTIAYEGTKGGIDISGLTLGRGEAETMALFSQGYGEFIVLDDRRGVALCRRENIPHINALLIPRILFLGDIIDEALYRKTFEKLLERGYYGKKVVDFAAKVEKKDVGRFFPAV